MTIEIRYFASLRDQLGKAGDRFQPERALTVAELWRQLWPDTPLPDQTLVAVNQEYASADRTVQDGDEVAFFPPVTGG